MPETMRRACRLGADTGMNAFCRSREQAIDYMSKHTVKTGKDIQVEIDRYIAWSGKAHVCKNGELKILELRNRAEKKRRERFNILDFHDVVLVDGAAPMDVLERHVNYYIKSNAN
tara:strand:- start:528 stop:872 length:345 start_codon:yes stop_codon:yes gene_type:complete